MSMPDKKPVLLIGTFRNDKLRNEIYLSGREAQAMNLTSSPSNWDKVIAFLEQKRFEVSYTVLSLTESVLLISRRGIFRELLGRIFDLLQDVKHSVFIYEDNLFGKFNIFTFEFYTKYLYYEEYYEDRDLFSSLMRDYYDQKEDFERRKARNFLVEKILPAAIFAKAGDWERFCSRSGNSHFHYRLLKDDYGDDIDVEQLLYELRNSLELTKEEKVRYVQQNQQERLDLLNSKLENWRIKRYTIETNGDIEILKFYQFSSENIDVNDYEWNRSGYEDFHFYLNKYRYLEDPEIRSAIIDMNSLIQELNTKKLCLNTYASSNDVVLIIREFFANNDQDIVFRSYILREQLWANELDEFLNLFQEYITVIRGVNIVFEQNKTDIGVVYVIKSNSQDAVRNEFSNYVHDFDSFLEKCEFNVFEARSILQSYNCNDKKIDYYITKFQTGARRLRTDIRQEYERRMLALRHCIENEALEEGASNALTDVQKQVLPPTSNPSMVIHIGNSFSVHQTGEIGKIIWGDYQYNETDTQLIEFIKRLSDEQENLLAELNILRDRKTNSSTKSTAWAKLKGFLAKNASVIGDVAFKLLCKYIEDLAQGN